MIITLSALVQAIGDRVLAEASELNRLDGVAGDGDLGVTMSAAARAVIDVAPGLDEKPLDEALRELGTTVARRAPSTAGTLVATALLAMARMPLEEDESAVSGIARRLASAQEAIETRGGAHVGEKTLLDALAPAVDALRDAERAESPFASALHAATAAARDGAEQTREMRAQVGRAGWLAARSAGSVDAGAALVAVMFEAAKEFVGATEGP
jgi:dihydroxyacetone kinase